MTDIPAVRAVFDGHSLIDREFPDDRVEGWPRIAMQATRAMAHLTLGAVTPAPVVYDVLGDLKQVAWRLAEVSANLSAGLAASLGQFEAYQDDGSDPQAAVVAAQAALAQAVASAQALSAAFEAAQGAIAQQGFRR